jgi:hypothetical protein
VGKKILKLIAIDPLQYSRLREHGKAGRSFNDAMKAILDKVENEKKKQQQTMKALETPLIS